jgi:hypothetical protein
VKAPFTVPDSYAVGVVATTLTLGRLDVEDTHVGRLNEPILVFQPKSLVVA